MRFLKTLSIFSILIFSFAMNAWAGLSDQISVTRSDTQSVPNCGILSLAHVLRSSGKIAAATEVSALLPDSLQGSSALDLQQISARYDLPLTALKLTPSELNTLPLPAIVHLNTQGRLTGHYVVLENASDEFLSFYDPQANHRYLQSISEFSASWSGIILSTGFGRINPAKALSQKVASLVFGGDGGVPAAPIGQGDPGPPNPCETDNPAGGGGGGGSGGGPGGSPCSDCGAPTWSINLVNMNLYVSDTPLWYSPAVGPKVAIRVNYNVSYALNSTEPQVFGKMWRFNYLSYIKDEGAGKKLVVLPDSSHNRFGPNGSGGYTPGYQVYNRLVETSPNHFELQFPDGTAYLYEVPNASGVTQPFLSAIRDPYNQSLTLGYNTSGQLATITDALGSVTTLTYTNNKITRVTDPFGRFATFEYLNDDLIKITDMGGYWSKLAYNQDHDLIKIEDDRGATSFQYEKPTNTPVIENYPAPGAPMGYSYRITVTNALGQKSEYYYCGTSGYGWYVAPRDYMEYVDQNNNNYANNVPRTIYYYANTLKGQREEIKDVIYPEGTKTIRNIDNATGLVLSSSDYYGNVTTYQYNSMGRVTYQKAPNGQEIFYTYDPTNNTDLLTIRNSLGTVTMTYDTHHRVTSITDIMGRYTGPIVYNSYGQLASITKVIPGQPNIVTQNIYDLGSHRLLRTEVNAKIVAEYTYDPIGRVQTSKNTTGIVMAYEYNNLDQVTRVIYPDAKFTSNNYSTCCPRLLDSATDRAGRITRYYYDDVKRLAVTVNPEGGRQQYEYDPNGNLLKFIDPNGNATQYAYDLQNRLLKKTYADGKYYSYGYDKNGQLVWRHDSRGIRTDYAYDEDGQIIGTNYSDDTPAVTYERDNFGRIVNVQDGSGIYRYTYYNDSSLQTIDGPLNNDTLTYVYDELGRQKTRTLIGSDPLTYAYDDLSRLVSIASGTTTYTYAYESQVSPLIQSLTRPDQSVTGYTYDSLKRLTQISNKKSNQDIINQYNYSFNHPDFQLDQRSDELVSGVTVIKPQQNETLSYENNNLNQLTQISALGSPPSALSLAYDANGNLTKGYTPQGYEFTAAYDAENRLKNLEYTDNQAKVRTTVYTYRADSFLVKIEKFENHVKMSELNFVGEGFLPIQERDGNNNVIREYTWGQNMGGGIGGLLSVHYQGQDYSYLYDGKGNVTAVTDSNQNTVATYAYDEFGKVVSKTGTLDQPFQFSTKYYDQQTGLNYFGYRFYSAALGRWINRDPLGEEGGVNLYGFVGNDPINGVDPLGLKHWSAGWGMYFPDPWDDLPPGVDPWLPGPYPDNLKVCPYECKKSWSDCFVKCFTTTNPWYKSLILGWVGGAGVASGVVTTSIAAPVGAAAAGAGAANAGWVMGTSIGCAFVCTVDHCSY